jgi:hypothetical protein
MLLRIRSHPQVAMSAFGPLGIELRASAGGGFADEAPHEDRAAVWTYTTEYDRKRFCIAPGPR